jgi:hypothetical protein
MTRRVATGAAVALAAGVGLGAWLTPPPAHYGSTTPVVVTPPEQQQDVWTSDVANAAPLPYGQPDASAVDAAYQTAAVSPPAPDASPNWRVQPAVQTTGQAQSRSDDAGQQAWQPAFPPKAPVHVAYNARAQASPAAGRDGAEEDNGAYRDAFDDRQGPPPQPPRPPMQGRRWDFRPDGSAVPLDDGGE